MPNAWDALLSRSAVPIESDAWTHLNNQQGGTGDIYIDEGILVIDVASEVDMSSINSKLTFSCSDDSIVISELANEVEIGDNGGHINAD